MCSDEVRHGRSWIARLQPMELSRLPAFLRTSYSLNTIRGSATAMATVVAADRDTAGIVVPGYTELPGEGNAAGWRC